MKIVLSGYFGFGNIGDEAILEAVILGLRQKLPQVEITVLSSTPEKTSEMYNVNAVNRFRYSKVVKELKAADMLISGGGGLIQDVTGPLTIFYYLGIIWLARRFRKTTVILGQGFGPVRRPLSKIFARWILNQVDLIIVRDEKSSDDMIAMGIRKPPIHVAGDVTPMLPLLDQEKSRALLSAEGIEKCGKPLVGFSIRRPTSKLANVKAAQYYQTIAAVADHIVEKLGAKLVFIPFHYPTDILESAKIINLMRNPVNIILREYSPVEILAIISQTDLFIGMRLHSMIFSAMANVPMVGIAYDPKVKTFLRQIGQRWIDVLEVDEKKLIGLVEEIWANRDDIRAGLSPWARDLKTKAKINFEVLLGYMQSTAVREVLGINFDNISINDAVQKIDEMIKSHQPHLIVTPNPEILLSSRKDESLKETINGASLRICDGIGVIWASKVLGHPIAERIAGIDLAQELAALCEKRGYKLFLLGSAPGIAEGAAEYLLTKHPKLKVVGAYHGYFSHEESSKIVENVRGQKPDVLLVGLGSPKQEKWARQNLGKFGASLVMTVGGSLDVLSGRVKRAPKWMRRVGLEWLYRLIREPWRWRRQLALVKFIFVVIFTRLFLRSGRR